MKVLTNISKTYGSHTVLQDLNLSLSEGHITCLLGPSGCGKSTLLRILGGLTTPDEGIIHIDATNYAIVFQEPRLLPWLTVAENLAIALPFGYKNKDSIIDEALEKVQLKGIQDMLPRSLSGGMAQRVGLVRALLQNPKILLMDEPFAALDAITRNEQQNNLCTLINKQKITCLFVTHDITEAIKISQHILIIRDGNIIAKFSRTENGYPIELKKQILELLDTQH